MSNNNTKQSNIPNDSRNQELSPTVNKRVRKFTYWIKYAGIVNGAMGILTRRQCIPTHITKKSLTLKLNTPDYLISPLNKLAKYEDNKLRKHFNASCIKHSLKKTMTGWDKNALLRNFRKKRSQANRIKHIMNKSIVNNKIKHNCNGTVYCGHSSFKNNSTSSVKLNEELITGVPIPEKYKQPIITSYMHSRKLCKVQKIRPVHKNITESLQVIGKILEMKTKRVKLFSQLLFTNRKLKEKLQNHLWVPSPDHLNEGDFNHNKLVGRGFIKRSQLNRRNHIKGIEALRIHSQLEAEHGFFSNKAIPIHNKSHITMNPKSEQCAEYELLCKELNISIYNK